MSKKVYFVGSAYMGCYYVRCFLPMMVNGWTGTYTGLSKNTLKPVPVVEGEMKRADIIVFHRPNTNWHHRIAMELKAMGKQIVFDNDDTYLLDSSHPFQSLDEKGFEENKMRINNVVNNFIVNADMITCSTEYLSGEYMQLNTNTKVLPNCVSPDDWNDEPLKNDTDKVRVGLVGSVCYHHDFSVIKELIKELDDSDKVQLVLFGLWKDKKRSDNPLVEEVHRKEFAFWDSIKNKEHAPWCDMSEYADTLDQLRLDMMLIPRIENHFNKCKSNLKFLEAGMLEIPVIASGFTNSPYSVDIDGTNGVLVGEVEEWRDKVWDLVNDKDKRVKMGKEAKQYVIKHYSIEDKAHLWSDAYESLYEK